MNSLILRTIIRILLPLLVLFSIFVLLRGHNEPGGGFIGGLLVAGAFALYGLAYDAEKARELMRIDPRTLIGIGVLVAAVSGCFAFLQGQPFLTGIWTPIVLPGDVKIGTVLLFDIGVYLIVFGSALVILLTLSEE
jgi:multicomponent Na+:H+ antiporter subunit B